MAGLTPEQQKVRDAIVRIGQRRHESPKEIKAAIETGLVESNLTNPHHGDADSEGWRQERRSLYSNPTNLNASINRFYDETSAVEGKYHNAGDLAAAVQRPAAQYRGRYQEASSRADQLLRGIGQGSSSAPRSGSGRGFTVDITHPDSTEQFDEKGYDEARRRSIVGQLIAKHNPHSLLLRMGALTTDTPSKDDFTTTVDTTSIEKFKVPGVDTPAPSASGAGAGSDVVQRANIIDAKHMPYQWGGGHGAKIEDVRNATPLDCSGAVSAVLGINPRVSGEFEKWGKPGDGGNKGVTVYANGEHVLMKINGHFFGTSQTNPGGGAGWIPQGAISSQYLKRFVARHG